jgi:hypothetical protein
MLPGITLLLTIFGVALCFFPIIIYWWKKLAPDKAYLVLAIYWLINGILYFPEIFNWAWYNNITDQITLYYNLIDAPLILLMFYFIFKKELFKYGIFAFVLFELIITLWKGNNDDSNLIIIGVGSLICLALNIWGISKYFMKVNHTDDENVMVYVYAGFIFYYGLFAVVYNYNYLHTSGQQRPYVVFINYIAVCLATLLSSYGLWKYAYSKQYGDENY